MSIFGQPPALKSPEMNAVASNPVSSQSPGQVKTADGESGGTLSETEFFATANFSSQSKTRRFTVDGGTALERRLEETCQRVVEGVRALIPVNKLAGVILAGGYGRGEGGVLREAGDELPYNDMEFYVFTNGSALVDEPKYRDALHHLGHELSPKAGLEVEFKVLTSHKLRTATPSMFYYDLVARHRRLLGGEELLAGCQHHAEARTIPLCEATRLLMNRCTGLLFSSERLQHETFTDEDADFVGRNFAKAQLALGDVLLAARGRYHWSCRERHHRLLSLPPFGNQSWHEAICGHHAAGVEFKLHPFRSHSSRAILREQHAELKDMCERVWVWLENLRLTTNFTSAQEYALSPDDKCPETPAWRNRLVNARSFGLKAALGREGCRYPRQRLLHALGLLLWRAELPLDADGTGEAVRHELRTDARDFAGVVTAYSGLWARFN